MQAMFHCLQCTVVTNISLNSEHFDVTSVILECTKWRIVFFLFCLIACDGQ